MTDVHVDYFFDIPDVFVLKISNGELNILD